MAKVLLTIAESRCRSGYCKAGDQFVVEDLCPPVCHELWNTVYPYLFALQNGAALDHGDTKAMMFTAKCPDEGRVVVKGELIE